MEINVLEHTKTKLRLEVKGEDHTFLNILKTELYNDKSVKYAGYRIAHVHVGTPELILETEGKDPKKVLLDAVSRIKKVNKELLSQFKKI
jgi:DNA-directed RNA polymerase subunit L